MKDKKGFELAISTIILIVLGILVLVALGYAIKEGVISFQKNRGDILSTGEGAIAKKACEIACNSEDKITFCCNDFSIKGKEYYCNDSRLEIGCNIDCLDFSCE